MFIFGDVDLIFLGTRVLVAEFIDFFVGEGLDIFSFFVPYLMTMNPGLGSVVVK